MKCRGTVWFYTTSNAENNKLKMQHPATVPDNLARDLIVWFTKAGDIIFDPMCGSGTSFVVALQEGRHFIGVDISENYCQIARDRITNDNRHYD